MTSGDPAHAKPAPARPSIPLDRLVSVVGARWVVTALTADHIGQRMLVTPDRDQHQPRHPARASSLSSRARASASTVEKGNLTAAGRATRTTSYGIPRHRSGESGASDSLRV